MQSQRQPVIWRIKIFPERVRDMTNIAHGWELREERQDAWLCVTLTPQDGEADATPPVAEAVWEAANRHHVQQLVLELYDLQLLHSYLVGQLVLLARRVHAARGALRLVGLSEQNVQVLRACRLESGFAIYADRGGSDERSVIAGSYYSTRVKNSRSRSRRDWLFKQYSRAGT